MENIDVKERALKNISYSLLSFIWPVLIAFIVTPIVVHYFGIKEYGIYIFISTLISLVGILDFGASTALGKFISERHGGNDLEGLKKLFKTANTIFFIIGIVGSSVIMLSIFIGLSFFPVEIINSYREYIPAFIYAGILFFVSSVSGLYTMIPVVYQRFDIGSKIGIFFITTQQLSILAVVFLNLSINLLFLSQVIIAAIFYFIYRKYAMSILNNEEKLYVGVYGWDKIEAIKCYKFGIVSFLNSLAGSSITYLDRMIIPLFLGPSNLTFYSLSGSITNKIPSLSNTLSSVVFPMTSYFEGEGNRGMTRNLYVRSMRLITIISTAITVTFIVFAYPMLKFWISEDVANKSSDVLIVLALTNLILAIIGPLSSFLLGMGRLRLLSITSVIIAVLNAALLVILLPMFGIIGAAWAYLLALIPYIYLLYKTEHSYLELAFRKVHYIKLVSQLCVTSIVIFLIDLFIVKPLIINFLLVVVAVVFSCVAFIFVHYLFGFFEKEDIRDILNFIKLVINRFK